jgi:error-prone DNA polymerase
MSAYAELQVTSNFSFLRGGSHAEELVWTAQALGLGAIAVTDRNTLAGVVRAHVAAKAAGLKFLVGARLDFADGAPSVLCFPTDRAAYGRLTKLLSAGQMRAEKGACELHYDDLRAHGEGQVFVVLAPLDLPSPLRGGAGGGGAGANVQRFAPIPPSLPSPARGEEALPSTFEEFLARFAKDFPGSVYLAASRLYGARDLKRLHQLSEIARQAGVPMVATGDILYHAPERRALQDVLTCIREKCTIAEAGLRLEANAERHLKSPIEMKRLFAAHPDAIARTMEIAARCTFSLDDLRYEYPDEPVPPGKTAQGHLEDLTWAGADWRYPKGVPEKVRLQLRKELDFISEKDIPQYFLTVHDIVRWAREGEKEPGKATKILCQGRGSAANSAVCFCLGVTAVDPTENDLLFERFLSKERNEPPDIDVDFEHERREEVIQYIYKRYGRHRAAICATVIHYRQRSAIRDVGKALGLTEDVTEALAGTVWGSWGGQGAGLPDKHVVEAGFAPDNMEVRRAVDLANELLDFPRHLSQHVGGFVLTQGRLDETVPIGNAAMDERTFLEWDKDDIDALGLMKIDVLALGMLSCIRRCFDFLQQHHALPYDDVADVPPDDAGVYEMLSRGDSVGVFQVESRAQMSMLPRLKPKNFYDLVIEVAIVRPGPIQGDMVHPYLRRRDGIDPIVYPAPAPEHGPADELKQILHRTLGIPLFQEQAMSIAIKAAKFTPEEANGLRRAMATFRNVGTMHQYEELFVGRMIARGYPPDFAKRQFDQIKGFGSYGFPESHAASFAKLVYVSAWIKHHYPAAFCAAILNSQPMGFYQPAQLVRDAREHGVEVRAPDVRASAWDCTLERAVGGAAVVRLGLRLVSGLQQEEALKLIAAREAGARSVEEIARKAGLARGVLERIAEADAFRSEDMDRRAALWRVSGLKGERTVEKEAPLLAGMNAAPEEVALPAMPLREHVAEDYRSIGLSLKAHPCAFFRGGLSKRGVLRAVELEDAAPDQKVRVAGLVLNRQRPGTAKNVMFATLEDETGIVNLVVWDRIFQAQRRDWMTSGFMLVEGRVQKANGVIHVVADTVRDLTALLARLSGDAANAPLQRSRDFH